jgi:Domain of unknown function (DUF4852)
MKKYIGFFLYFALLVFPAFAQQQSPIRYVEPTITNISDVLFRKGILKTDDPAAVEEYIRLHACGLYEHYASDDFAWARIREGYARDIAVNLKTLPDGLEIVSALPLGLYDIEKSEFLIDETAQMDQTTLITAISGKGGSLSACEGRDVAAFVPRVHPLELIVKMDQPVTLKSIPMDSNAADKLINAWW